MAEGFRIDLSKVEVRGDGEVVIKDAKLVDALKHTRGASDDDEPNGFLDWKCTNKGCL